MVSEFIERLVQNLIDFDLEKHADMYSGSMMNVNDSLLNMTLQGQVRHLKFETDELEEVIRHTEDSREFFTVFFQKQICAFIADYYKKVVPVLRDNPEVEFFYESVEFVWYVKPNSNNDRYWTRFFNQNINNADIKSASFAIDFFSSDRGLSQTGKDRA